MRWHFVATKNLESWDWRNPDALGIGNSETSMIEMAGRLAAVGHDVTCYGELPDDARDDPRGSKWRRLSTVDCAQPGVWVLYRCPELLDRFALPHQDQQVWLMMQDTHYDSATPERASKLDRVLVLCDAQRAFIADRFPELAAKLVVTSNGVRVDMIEDVEAECPYPRSLHENDYVVRNPHRMHFSSSPDRGLKVLLQRILPRVREYVPDVELHVYYGWNNIDKLMETDDGKRYFGPNKAETEALLKQPNVTMHGRVGQRELTREWLKAGLWVFPSMFPETSCATCMEAQALGAIPIATPLWAVGENVRHGSIIDGDAYTDPLTIARYVAEVVRWCDVEQQATTRREMMAWARARFDWQRFVPQWEALAGIGVLEGAVAC